MALNYDIQNHQYTVRQGHRSYQHHYSKALGWKLNALNFTKFHHKTEPVISVTIATSSATFIIHSTVTQNLGSSMNLDLVTCLTVSHCLS